MRRVSRSSLLLSQSIFHLSSVCLASCVVLAGTVASVCSFDNKGQLSAWRLLETADLLSIVKNLYRTGGKMLLADPLSRLCAPGDGFYDVSLPGKINVLLQNLPQQVAECAAMRLSANKDTAAVARIVQKWRKPTNPISQGRLGSAISGTQAAAWGG